VFGGIYEITKELNDLHMFDLKKKKWVTVFEESNSPVKGREHSPTFMHEGDGFQSTIGGASGTIGSPLQGKKSLLASPMKHMSGVSQ
jgi:Galactose oxidase, central domain